MPEWAAEEFSKCKTLTKVNKVRKKLKSGDYSKVSTIALGPDASWGRLAINRVPLPTVEAAILSTIGFCSMVNGKCPFAAS